MKWGKIHMGTWERNERLKCDSSVGENNLPKILLAKYIVLFAECTKDKTKSHFFLSPALDNQILIKRQGC